MRYLGTSVLRSAPGAVIPGSGEPASVTSRTGHCLGFLTQNFKKSNAYSSGSTTRFAWANPLASPPVGPAYSPWRMRSRTSRASMSRMSSFCSINSAPFLLLNLTVHDTLRDRRLFSSDADGHALQSFPCWREPLHYLWVVARDYVGRGASERTHEIEGAIHP